MSGWVCAFRGRRDSYQVPLALAEADMLDQFITDAYAKPWLRSLAHLGSSSVQTMADFRCDPRIPSGKVRSLWGTTTLEHLRDQLGYAPMKTYGKLDRWYSREAGKRAANNRSDLFLYSSYAWDAFTRAYPHQPRKVMFQYHPHPALEARILQEDGARYPGIGESFSGSEFGQVPNGLDAEAWKYADLIFCASSFTRQSLLGVGADAAKCRVVPYGIDPPSPASTTTKSDGQFQVLFAGSGGQRKGLHHLLLAWQRAKLPSDSRLILVCRVIDDGIAALAAKLPGVTLRQGTSTDELVQLYQTSTVLALPSLVEGFGQVYLEALVQGCPVLGTVNTGLPDLGNEHDGIFLVPPGEVEALTEQLERLAQLLPANPSWREAARTCADRFTWDAFRGKLRAGLMGHPS